MYWRLTPTLTAAVAAEQAILLDIASDRYRRPPARLNDGFVRWLCEEGGALPSGYHSILQSAPHHADAEPIVATPVALSIPTGLDATAPVPLPAGGLFALASLRAVMATRKALHRTPLREVLESMSARSAVRPSTDAAVDTLRRAAKFAAIRPFIPVTRVCLLDSLALLRLVGRTDASVRLVFGVTGLPFSAHCWVQTNDRLLNDHPDVVARYAPILHLGR